MTGNSRYRDWLTAAACAVGVMLGITTVILGTFPLLLQPVCAELGWSRGLFSAGLGTAGMVAALTTPLIGRGIDRWGARKFVLPGMILFAVGIMALSRLTPSPLRMYLLFAPLGLTGQMCGLVPLTKVISATFHERRGLMLALIVGGGMTASLAAAPPITRFLVLAYGWRNAYVFIGLAVLIIGFPVMLLFLREPRASGISKNESTSGLPGVAVREAVCSSTFWIIMGSALLMGIATSGFNAHSFAWLTGRGISGSLATTLIAVIPIAGL